MERVMIMWLTFSQNFCHAVMNNPELPLDPNLQTSNLLITFLKYASIVMQDTKGEHRLSLLFDYKSFFFPFIASVPLLGGNTFTLFPPIVLALHSRFFWVNPFPKHLSHFIGLFPDEHRLNSARLCLIILTCIAEVGRKTAATFVPNTDSDFFF